MDGKISVIVATISFGMGVDKVRALFVSRKDHQDHYNESQCICDR
jgi:superfamily II DNA helicase RecQ